MSVPKLAVLLSDDFEFKYCMLDYPARLRLLMLEDNSVTELHEAIRVGEISWEQLKEFVDTIVSGFKPGFTLDGDIALCAIAVAIEDFESEFSEEYLNKLSKLKAAEVRKPVRVAIECLRALCEKQTKAVEELDKQLAENPVSMRIPGVE